MLLNNFPKIHIISTQSLPKEENAAKTQASVSFWIADIPIPDPEEEAADKVVLGQN